jgi:hypothetical protein
MSGNCARFKAKVTQNYTRKRMDAVSGDGATVRCAGAKYRGVNKEVTDFRYLKKEKMRRAKDDKVDTLKKGGAGNQPTPLSKRRARTVLDFALHLSGEARERRPVVVVREIEL